jgi:molybdopterin/thiamine biosynthesis adenylyltransferase
MLDEAGSASEKRRRDALTSTQRQIDEWNGRPLDREELAAYPSRGAVHGWRVGIQFSDGKTRQFDILANEQFPVGPARVALVDRPTFLTWPHVEKDGVLCLTHQGYALSANAPADVVVSLMAEACQLIEDASQGRLDDDFRSEFNSYWDWATAEEAPPVWSALRAGGPSRVVRAWKSAVRCYVGEDDASLKSWLTAIRPSAPKGGYATEPATLAWLNQAPLPAEYPNSPGELLALLPPDAVDLVLKLAAVDPSGLVVLLGAPTNNGVALAAVALQRASGSVRGGGPKPGKRQAGFRPGHVPPDVAGRRFLGSALAKRSSVSRCDAAWIHGRDQDVRFESLHEKRVTVLGCGSVGAPIAIALAQAGVGFLRLVDSDVLSPANAGRHPLGLSRAGVPKAVALKESIAQRLPHLRLEDHPCRWQDLPADVNVLDADLIVSAMGDWAAEEGLNVIHLEAGRPAPILYGWTEAHACVGHAVLIDAEGGCLQCGFNDHGQNLLHVTAWPEAQIRQEPACGAHFQPYGPVELAYITSMIAERALDRLLRCDGAGHSLWIGAARRLAGLGGTYTEAWKEAGLTAPLLGGVVERHWPHDPWCRLCGNGR